MALQGTKTDIIILYIINQSINESSNHSSGINGSQPHSPLFRPDQTYPHLEMSGAEEMGVEPTPTTAAEYTITSLFAKDVKKVEEEMGVEQPTVVAGTKVGYYQLLCLIQHYGARNLAILDPPGVIAAARGWRMIE